MIQVEPNHSFISEVHHGKLTVSLRTLSYHLGRLLQNPCPPLVQVGLHLLLG